MFCHCVLSWDPRLSEQKTEQISYRVIRNFHKSSPCSPSSPPFNHVLFCWKLLSLPVVAPTVSSELRYPWFTCRLYLLLFPHCLFCSHYIAFIKGLLGTCLQWSWTLRALLSLHHFSRCSSMHTLRNQSALIICYIYRGFRAAVLKEKLWRNSDFKRGLILLDQFGLRTLE